MDVRELLEQVKSGSVEIEDAQMRLKNLPYEDLGYAKLDHHRKLRSGFGETVFCQGKPDAYLLEIYKKFYERDGEVLGTRASESQAELVSMVLAQEDVPFSEKRISEILEECKNQIVYVNALRCASTMDGDDE